MDPRKLISTGFGRTALIYGIEQTDDGRWRAHNRRYETLGEPVKFARHPRTFANVWHSSNEEGTKFWLYQDSMESRDGYFERMERLISHKAS